MRIKRQIVAAVAVLGLSLTPQLAFAETMKQALGSAYANNPNIAAALLAVKVAAEDIALRRSGKLPTIGASADLSHSYSVVGGTTTNSRTFSVGASYRQTLFDSMQTDAQIEQARALAAAAGQALRNAEQNVLLSAASAYANVVRDTQLVTLRQNNVAFFAAQVKSAKDREEIGEGTRVEIAQAESGYAQAIASYKDAISALQTSQAGYNRWIGHNPSNLSLNFAFGHLLPNSLNAALNYADGAHPAILSAQAQMRAAQAGADAARNAFGPTLDLIGSICALQCFGGSSQGMSASVRLTLSIPIYAGGALGASLRQANLRQVQSEVDALNARDQVRESVVSAWAGVNNADAQINAAQSAERSAQLALEGVIEERNVGQSTTLDVLNARSTLTSAQELSIIASTGKVVASFSLLSAIGKLNAEYLNLPVHIQSGQGYTQKVEDVWAELRSLPIN